MTTPFDPAPELVGETLALRPLVPADFDGLLAAAADPAIWAGHPATDRYRPDAFRTYFDFLVAAGGGLAVIDRQSGRIIGCSRFYVAPDTPEAISIGFTFLARAWWGGAANLELKRLMLAHAFARFPVVWFHIAPSNIRSQKATAKLGARYVRTATLDLSGVPAEWMCFRLTRADWQAAGGESTRP